MIERHPDGRLKLSQEQNRRFLTKIRFPEGEDGCWEWVSSLSKTGGYGEFHFLGKTSKSHRLSYELFVAALGDDDHVLHRCDNPRCVRPGHLFVGTHEDNMRDMAAKRRSRHGEGHHGAKLSAFLVRCMRALKSQGVHSDRLAGMFRVNASCVDKVCSGRSWRHVQMEVSV